MPLIYQRETRSAQFFSQQLSPTVSLDMVIIPRGSFLMGSPPKERGRLDREGPQHSVTVPSFCMGKYPITQAQWRVVADLPQVEQALDPDPSRFKGDDRPVEQVSWDDAVEFCARLRALTGRDYRLPSEAEWEYACRAGTTTPFHFGETITPELANYRWSETYGEIKATKQKDFEGTTPVGQFGAANAFGLYDMHGNVWEWCADHWHEPTDGSFGLRDRESSKRLQRGGSGHTSPGNCRSAYRGNSPRADRYDNLGFRVSCSAARTLPSPSAL
jgi:formylglycine-generating enzyme required for sulfatase activity